MKYYLLSEQDMDEILWEIEYHARRMEGAVKNKFGEQQIRQEEEDTWEKRRNDSSIQRDDAGDCF